MTDPTEMYRWRKLTPQQRTEILKSRQSRKLPWHSPPHYDSTETTFYMITAACYEHRHIIGKDDDRMATFEDKLVERLQKTCEHVFAWSVLPNHYHVLIDSRSVRETLRELGQLHGSRSFYWNGEEDQRGRKVWCNAAETAMKSEGHFYASLNYIWHNAVHHGYVQKWDDWPYTNASDYLQRVGRDKALKTWRRYPLYDYGKDWDPANL